MVLLLLFLRSARGTGRWRRTNWTFLMTWSRAVMFAYSMRGTLRLEMFEIFRCEKDVAYGHFSSQNLFTMKSTDN